MAFTITTTDGHTFEATEIGHQTDGSITFTDADGRKLRLAGHYWMVIEGSSGADLPHPAH
jgi:hypothetical protein